MKTTYRMFMMATVVAGLAVIGQANAQSQIAADNGIAASPKARAQLNERKAQLNSAVAAPAAVAPAHKCADCTDTWVTVVDKGTKGPNHLVTKVSRHNCAACDTKITVVGTGKAKHDVAAHSCNAELRPLCCAMN
jgi:hypothetical protein